MTPNAVSEFYRRPWIKLLLAEQRTLARRMTEMAQAGGYGSPEYAELDARWERITGDLWAVHPLNPANTVAS